MMKIIIRLTLLSCLLLSAGSVYAQPGVKYPYVDISQPGGPIIVSVDNASRDVKSAAIHPNWTTTPYHTQDDPENSVSAKFQVYPTPDQTSSFTYTGAQALTACPAGWRLPTIRELMLIVAMGGMGPTEYHESSSDMSQRTPPITKNLYNYPGMLALYYDKWTLGQYVHIWSSTRNSHNTDQLFAVHAVTLQVYPHEYVSTQVHLVRCIRDVN